MKDTTDHYEVPPPDPEDYGYKPGIGWLNTRDRDAYEEARQRWLGW